MQGHVFISYVREDSALVDKLEEVLQQAGIPFWRDIKSAPLGLDWKQTVRQALVKDALVVVACFSEASLSRERTAQREEIVLAVDEYRRRPHDRPWLIPARLSDVPLPYYDLGAGRSLEQLNWVDLFGDNWEPGCARLVEEIKRLLPIDESSGPDEADGPRGWFPASLRRRRGPAGWLGLVAMLLAAFGLWRWIGDPDTSGSADATSTTNIDAVDPGATESGETTTVSSASPAADCSRQLEALAEVEPGNEAGAASDLDFGDNVSYSVAVGEDDWMSMQVHGRMAGTVPAGQVVYLLAFPDDTPDETPAGQTPGNGRYYLVQRVEPDAEGCWSYSQPHVGYPGFCGITSIFTYALMSEELARDLEAEKAVPGSNANTNGFASSRMAPPDVSKLASFEVPSVQACS